MGNDNRRNDLDGQKPPPDVEESRTQRLLDDVMMSVMLAATKPPEIEVTGVGQVKTMEVPGNWEAGPDYSKRQHSATYQEFHPTGQRDSQLGFYYRGRRTSEMAGKNFHALLDKPPHTLAEAELKALKEVVRDKANPEDFQVKSARTEDLNGKRVLILEGRYTANQNDSKHIFIDADGSGTSVQEIFFQAPKDKFQTYVNTADQALKSIHWK